MKLQLKITQIRPLWFTLIALVFLTSAPAFSQKINLKVWQNLTTAELSTMAYFVLETVPEHGLYITRSEERLMEQIREAEQLEPFRNQLITLYSMVARQLFTGRYNPKDVGNDIRFQKKIITDERLRQIVIESGGTVEGFVNLLEPKFADYQMLLNVLHRLETLQAHETWEPIGKFKKPLKLNMVDPAVLRIKNRLVAYGFKIDQLDEKFDVQTEAAVIDVQTQLKKSPDKIVSPGGGTIRYLETPLQNRIDQVRADLEQIRWLPQTPAEKYIFVNLAFNSFLLVDYTRGENPVVFNFRTINGRVARKTPSMLDKIYQIVLNPFWTVPKTIFMLDKVPILQDMNRNQIKAYFAENNYTVVSENYKKVFDPAGINWDRIDSADTGFYIRQKPNYYNALGVVRFSLTNGEAIFLHDTGDRDLFQGENRLLSSGCVRLEKPIDLAEYLLTGTVWTRAAIENFVSKPGQVLEVETKVKVPFQIPVILLPVTSHMATDGIMRFTEDVYGHTESIKNLDQYLVL